MPATKVVTRGKNQTEKPNTRAEGRSDSDPLIPEDNQDIKDSLQGRKFLERHLLLCPEGEPPSHTSLATCLHQMSAMLGVQKTVLNALRSVAFMLEEMEDTQINIAVKEVFDSQMTEFTADMKALIIDAREKLDGHFKATEERLTQVINVTGATYASALSTPPPHANLRIAAREGIKARQLLLEGIPDTKFSHTDVFQLKAEINKILGTLGVDKVQIRSVTKLRNGNALVEM